MSFVPPQGASNQHFQSESSRTARSPSGRGNRSSSTGSTSFGSSSSSITLSLLPPSPQPVYAGNVASPKSPVSSSGSTASASSPQAFHTPALSSYSDNSGPFRDYEYDSSSRDASFRGRQYSLDGGADLGDRTITLNYSPRATLAAPADTSSSHGKGKERLREITFDDTAANYSPDFDYDDPPETEESTRRIEENLKRWAAQEKLRRAKTRGKQGSTTSITPSLASDSVSAIQGLARRMSGSNSRSIQVNGHPKRPGVRIDSLDSASEASKQSSTDDYEMQTQPPRRPGHIHTLSQISTTSIDQNPFASPVTSPSERPLSAVSTDMADRVERAVRTGSRFIEDLEDPEVRSLHSYDGAPQAQTYAELNSPLASPITSPIRSSGQGDSKTPKPSRFRRKFGFRQDSIASLASLNTIDSKETVTRFSHSSNRASRTVDSPVDQNYFPHLEDESMHRLVSARHGARDYQTRIHPEAEYSEEDDEYNPHRPVGWLEWILCCGCCNSAVRLEDDEQAGRTFPE